MPSVRENLITHLENGEDWEKIDTPVKGVFVVKVPKTKTRDAKLYLEIKPLNRYGSSLKKKGVYISNAEFLISLAEAIADDKIFILTSILEDINKKAYSKLNGYDQKSGNIRDQLLNHLNNGEAWEKMETPIEGVYLVKGPNKNYQQTRLFLEVKPVDESGKPLKWKGLFISSKIELISLAEALLDDQSYQLMKIMDEVNKKKNHRMGVLEDEVQEIIIEKEIKPEKQVRISSKKLPKNVEKLYNDFISNFKTNFNIEGELNVKNIIKKINEMLILHGKSSHSPETHSQKETYWKNIIAEGETKIVEFKSSLRYDYNTKELNKGLQYSIAKEISGFLNTEGGKVIIGVNDNGILLGLDNDYKILRKKNKDGFNLALVQLITNHIGEEFNDYWQTTFIKIDNKEICIIEVKKSPKPVITHKTSKEDDFYIRSGHATIPLNRKKMLGYISNHFKN